MVTVTVTIGGDKVEPSPVEAVIPPKPFFDKSARPVSRTAKPAAKPTSKNDAKPAAKPAAKNDTDGADSTNASRKSRIQYPHLSPEAREKAKIKYGTDHQELIDKIREVDPEAIDDDYKPCTEDCLRMLNYYDNSEDFEWEWT